MKSAQVIYHALLAILIPFPALVPLSPLCLLCKLELEEKTNALQFLSKSIEDKKSGAGGGERSGVIYFLEKDSISFCLRHMTRWKGKVRASLVWGQ